MEKIIKKINSGAELTEVEQLLMLTGNQAVDLLKTYIKNHRLTPFVEADMLLLPDAPALLEVYAQKYPLHPRAENELVKSEHIYDLAEIYIKNGHKFWDKAELEFLKHPYNKPLITLYIEQNKNILSDDALDIIEKHYFN
ncbi:MAG: hypothetical protein J6C85_07845 [Alphaproteobacteria bacterium]|nr:hypothetical protein [Alphaproteobacteria bacterium]